MTAEIAILNRSAVTLAADSAMTLSVGGRKKIYASTDKIFELSEKDPIGLMIYNNLEFMGAPIDVLIKEFRRSPHCCAFEKLADSPTKFFEYLSSAWPHTDEIQKRHARQILAPIYVSVRKKFDASITELIQAKKRVLSKKVFPLLSSCIEDKIREYEKFPVSTCFEGISEEHIEDFYADVLDEIIAKVFRSPPLKEPERKQWRRLGVLALHRDSLSNLLTGLVFTGYGRSEVFPSLLAYHTDGIIAGKLKTKLTDDFATSRERVSAKIIPFAQREVVDRFLVGIDPHLEKGIKDYFKKASDITGRDLFDGVDGLDAKARKQILANLKGSMGAAVSDFGPGWLEKTKDSYSQQTEDMVLFMAKQESAHLAEALVNITSLKRKYSPDEESVAGPIDVAVISRNDGFVWVKRKHYFPAQLNQRYFVRKFGAHGPQQGGDDATETV